MILIQIKSDIGNALFKIKTEVLSNDLDLLKSADGSSLLGECQIGSQSGGHIEAVFTLIISNIVHAGILWLACYHGNALPCRDCYFKGEVNHAAIGVYGGEDTQWPL